MNEPKIYDLQGAFMTEVRNMLRDDPRTLLEIYHATELPFYWLRKFAAGEIKNPSVNRVVYLYTCLSGKTLEF